MSPWQLLVTLALLGLTVWAAVAIIRACIRARHRRQDRALRAVAEAARTAAAAMYYNPRSEADRVEEFLDAAIRQHGERRA